MGLSRKEEYAFILAVLTLFLMLTLYYAAMAEHYCRIACNALNMDVRYYNGITAKCECWISPERVTKLITDVDKELGFNITQGLNTSPTPK